MVSIRSALALAALLALTLGGCASSRYAPKEERSAFDLLTDDEASLEEWALQEDKELRDYRAAADARYASLALDPLPWPPPDVRIQSHQVEYDGNPLRLTATIASFNQARHDFRATKPGSADVAEVEVRFFNAYDVLLKRYDFSLEPCDLGMFNSGGPVYITWTENLSCLPTWSKIKVHLRVWVYDDIANRYHIPILLETYVQRTTLPSTGVINIVCSRSTQCAE